jgi:membrane protein YqaA with SNARE-associated domain
MNPDIFTQAFLSRLLPLYHEVVLNATLHFHPEQYPCDAVVAGAGALLASALFYAVGVWLRRMPARVSTQAQQARIARMQQTAHGWLPWLLILSPTPVGGILIIAAGFFAIRPVVAGAAIVAGEVLWRVSPLL